MGSRDVKQRKNDLYIVRFAIPKDGCTFKKMEIGKCDQTTPDSVCSMCSREESAIPTHPPVSAL